MKIVIDSVAALAILVWPAALLISIMTFGGPGATNDRFHIFTTTGFLSYPIFIFLIYSLIGAKLFLLNPRPLFIISIAAVIFAFYYLGYTKLIYNAYRGVNSDGYTVKLDSVYYKGDIVEGADPVTFEWKNIKNNKLNHYGKDKNQVFYDGKPLEGANPDTFKILPLVHEEYYDATDGEHYWRLGQPVTDPIQ